MPVKKVVTISNFAGGLNTVKHPSLLADGEFSRLENCFLLNGKIRQRPPMVVWPVLDGGAALMTGVTGIIGLTFSTGTWNLIALNPTELTKVVLGGTSVALTDAMSLAFASSYNVWRSTQYKNYGYAVRKDLTNIIRFNSTNYWSTGIAAPTTNAVIADGGVGTGEAGTFYGVYTFVDADGVESAPSPVSALVTVAANRFFAWSSVDVSTNPRVTKRNLYRTLPNQTGEYFFVTSINDNTSTTANEAILTTQMGDSAPVDNVVPPSKNWLDVETAFERLWVTDGSLVYGSAAEDPDSFPPDNVYAFSPDDGQPIRALKKRGTDLMVFKTGSLWALSQSLGAFEFLPRLVDEKNGCVATNSACSSDGYVFWYSGKAVFMSDGKTPGMDISTNRVAALGAIPDANKADAVACTYSRYGWYMISFPGLSQDIYVFDYRRNYWFTIYNRKRCYKPSSANWFTGTFPIFMTEVLDAYGTPHVFANFFNASGGAEAAVFDVFSADPDANVGDLGGVAGYGFGGVGVGGFSTAIPIETAITFRGLDFGSPGFLHCLVRVLLNHNTLAVTETMTLAAYLNSSLSAYKSRSSLTLDGVKEWKDYGLSTRGTKAGLTQVTLTRSSIYDLAISAVRFQGEVWGWQPEEGL